ncbi:hypothetical protein K505DRAFT_305322 [Melanomma pulvis-pyrius CBS 109.77]|uniref:Transcription initiation factor TFIID subunit 4 n=1 Tax=Melanomma pulvis-pyrius CBS 109.77 TaxID=1314802 RepID=A0A6A6XCR7_9PLEO|nr:hypothetical protein K505DRAFT_305322 [Melanomma pulvis-pyrius CBS 109.77]
MAHPQYNTYQQQLNNLPPVNTNTNPQLNLQNNQNYQNHQNHQGHAQNLQNLPQHHQQHHPNHAPGAFSPPSYQNSPSSMSPTAAGFHAAKRQRLSPNPPSPYQSPFSAGPNPYATSPYANSPPGNPYLALPHSPAAQQPQHAFHQPQQYQHPNDVNSRPPPPQGSMPPPKVPYSKTQDSSELEKANPRDMDVNNISDVLTGSGIDLRAEEDNLLHTFGSRPAYGNSFNSQQSASTASPHGSFNQWGQATQGHGAYQGTGVLSQVLSQEQHQAELLRKHAEAARALAESTQPPLTDPFLFANVLRHRVAKRAYEHGVKVNLEGLFDKIPDNPQNIARTSLTGSNGEVIAQLTADSLLNQNASFVDVISLISLATQERVRAVLEDSLALKEIRQKTSHGTVPHDMVDLAASDSNTKSVNVGPLNISKSSWEVPDSAISPMTQIASKQPANAARLPTPPTDAPPTPQPTIEFVENRVVNSLKRRASDDLKFEEARLAKRIKRKQGSSATPTDTPVVPTLPIPEKMSKKERDRLNKAGQTDDVLHRKANETASMALGKSKKYSWMMGGGKGGSGASTPKINTAVGSASGVHSPAQPQIDQALRANKRTFGEKIELSAIGERVQVRDLIHVLEDDGRERKTLTTILATIWSADKDMRTDDRRQATTVTPVR